MGHAFVSSSASMQSNPEKRRDTEGHRDGALGKPPADADAERETLMMELTRLVQKSLRESSWWERRGIDCSILTAAFISLPAGTHTFATIHYRLFRLTQNQSPNKQKILKLTPIQSPLYHLHEN